MSIVIYKSAIVSGSVGVIANDQTAAAFNASSIQSALVSAGNITIDTPGNIYIDGIDVPKGNVTITIASPGVFTLANHGLKYRDSVKFSTTGQLPTGIVAGVTYYVTFGGLTTNTFQVSATQTPAGGTPINTSGTQSGIHSVTRKEALKIYSNTNLTIAPGTTILPIDGANTGVFCNAATLSTPITLVGGVAGEMTWITLADGGYGIRVDKTGIGNTFPLGSVISVVMTGHLAVSDTHGYTQGFRGVWDVVLSSANSITYQIRRYTPGSGSFTYPPINGLAFVADQNITISGGGDIGGNGANQTLYGVGDPRGNVIWMNHAKNVTIDSINFTSRGTSWTVGSNYVRDYYVRNIGGDIRGGSANDMIHLSGQHQNVVIEKIRAGVGDNTVGMTIDITDDTTNVNNFTPGTGGASGPGLYNFPYQYPGDMFEVVARDMFSTNTIPFAVCGIYGPGSYKYENVVFDSIGSVQPANYPQTGMNNCRGGRMTVRNMHSQVTGPQMQMTGVQTWDSISVEDTSTINSTQETVKLDNTGTIGQFSLRNIVAVPSTTFRTQSLVSVGPGNYDSFVLTNIEGQRFGTNVALFKHTGAGTIGRLSFNNVSAIVNTGGAANAICSVTSTGAANSVDFINCALTSQGALGSMFVQGSGALYNTISFNNCRVTNGQGLFDGANTTAATNIFMSGVTLAGTNARAAQFSGPTKLFVNGYNELVAPTNNPFKLLTGASTVYNFDFSNIFTLKTDLIEFISGASLRINGTEAITNGANVTAPIVGDIFYNNTAASLRGTGVLLYDGATFRQVVHKTQVVASSATPALDVNLGTNVTFTATLASLWGAPTNVPPAGQRVTITITQGGAGSLAITWNAAYIFPTAFSNTGNVLGTRTVVNFVSDGTRLVAQGANSWYT